jgi:ATP-dependent DNA helicase HFM1/MER3
MAMPLLDIMFRLKLQDSFSIFRITQKYPRLLDYLPLISFSPLTLLQLSALCQAVEFRNLRFKPGEKAAYRELNKSNLIRFPIPTNVEIVSHKVSLIIQSVLGGVALPTGDDSGQLQQQFFQDCASIWHSVKRLIRCIIDFGLETHDSIAVRNGLMVCRSISAEAWDDGPLQMKQIEGIGIVSVRKLSSAGIRSLEMLEATEPHKIEYVFKRASPYGRKILDLLKGFPKLRISIQMLGRLVSKMVSKLCNL